MLQRRRHSVLLGRTPHTAERLARHTVSLVFRLLQLSSLDLLHQEVWISVWYLFLHEKIHLFDTNMTW